MSSEFQFINQMKRRFGLSAVGDDCAILPRDEHSELLISADMLVEDVDFRTTWATPETIGHKALAVSLSDIAAMGGTPLWSILSLAIPKVLWEDEFGPRFFDGYMKLAKRFGVELTGGDLSSSPHGVVVDSTVIGSVRKNGAIRRSGARAGQLLCVTGTLGGAAAALRLLDSETDAVSSHRDLIARLLTPMPKVDAGRILGELGICGSMIDVSDGLVGDLGHICDQSGVGAEISAASVPCFPSSKVTLDDALFGGEDFELLFTVDSKEFDSHQSELREHAVSVIGEITPNAGIITLNSEGERRELTRRGFVHF